MLRVKAMTLGGSRSEPGGVNAHRPAASMPCLVLGSVIASSLALLYEFTFNPV
jgi:hypothetical protein